MTKQQLIEAMTIATPEELQRVMESLREIEDEALTDKQEHAKDNRIRAAWALAALTSFNKLVNGGEDPIDMHPDDLADAISDLIADLLHLSRHVGISPNDSREHAVRNFTAEVADELQQTAAL